jgi:N-acetylglucosaminyldiphosphoundecaprenol N-acetyl-beta-D-mannosaminyltransferase
MDRRTTDARRIDLGPIGLDPLAIDDVMERVKRSVIHRVPLHIVTANMQFFGTAARDAAFASLVRGAGLVVGDGVPLIWLSRLRGNPIPHRITGHDVVDACASVAAANGFSIGLLGGSPRAASIAADILRTRHPGLRIAGIFDGRFTPEGLAEPDGEEERLRAEMEQMRPDILFVALGCPKQEQWIARHLTTAGVPVCVGVGSVLDVLAGQRKRAPGWMQRLGLEWSFRFAQEPSRLWRRYFAQDLPMLAGAAVAVTSRRLRERLARQ